MQRVSQQGDRKRGCGRSSAQEDHHQDPLPPAPAGIPAGLSAATSCARTVVASSAVAAATLATAGAAAAFSSPS